MSKRNPTKSTRITFTYVWQTLMVVFFVAALSAAIVLSVNGSNASSLFVNAATFVILFFTGAMWRVKERATLATNSLRAETIAVGRPE